MTTDRLILRLLAALPVMLAGWLAVLALVLRLGGDAPGAFIPFPPAGLLQALAGDVSVTGHSALSVTLSGPDIVARAYAAGAWIVLPAGLEACIPSGLRRPL